MSVVLAEAVQRAVGRVLTEANGQVEALISAELDRQLAAIAQTVIAERLALAEAGVESEPNDPGARIAEAKICRVCNIERKLSEFEKHRATCRQCRREQARGKTFATAEADRPSVGPQPE